MKRSTILLATLFATLTVLASGQTVDKLNDEPPKSISRAEAQHNAGQPKLSLAGRRVVLRTKLSDCTINETDRASIEQAIQDVGADPVWDDDELQAEHGRRTALRGNEDVDPKTIPSKGTLQAHDLIAEVGISMMSGPQQSLDLFLGTFLRGFGFSYSGEASATIISVKFIDRETGSTRGFPILKVANVAGTTDRLGADILGGIIRGRAGIDYRSEDRAGRDQRSFDGAVRKLADVLKWRCGQR